MFSPISSPVPFYLGNSHPSPLPKAGGYKYSSPMAKLLTTPRSYLRLPHVNPLSQRIGITGQVTGNSLPGMTALTSMTKLSRSVEEASANSKPWVQWRNNHNPRSEFLTSPPPSHLQGGFHYPAIDHTALSHIAPPAVCTCSPLS